jgi:hypothetical protein
MAARRLLIVMLILLGLSTLAAALVPQRALRNGTTTGTTTTQSSPTTPSPPITDVLPPVAEITVGGKKFPVVAPVHVGDQLTLLVRSRRPREISIPEFGLIGFATRDTPARFELLPTTPGTFGILFAARHVIGEGVGAAASGKVVGRIEVMKRFAKGGKNEPTGKGEAAKSRARAGSGRA